MPLEVRHGAAAEPYLAGSDLTLPATAADGSARRHLDAATAGVMRRSDDGPAVLVCLETDADAALDRFLTTVAGAPASASAALPAQAP
jgi:hypothetical protein